MTTNKLPTERLATVFVIRNLQKYSREKDRFPLEVVLGLSETGHYYFFPALLAQDLFSLPARGGFASVREALLAPWRGRVYANTRNVEEVRKYMQVKHLGTPLSLRMLESWVGIRTRLMRKGPASDRLFFEEQIDLYRRARELLHGNPPSGTLLGNADHWGRQLKAPGLSFAEHALDAPRTKPVADDVPVPSTDTDQTEKSDADAQLHAAIPETPATKEKDMPTTPKEPRFTAGDLLRRLPDAEAPIAVKLVYEQTYMLYLAGRMTLDVALDLRSIAIRQATGLDLTINPNLTYGTEAPSTHTPLVPDLAVGKPTSTILVNSTNKPLELPHAVVVIPKTDDTDHMSAGQIGKPFELASLLVNDMAKELGVIGNPRFGKADSVFKGTGDAIKNSAGEPATYWLYNLEGQRIMAIACKELAALLADETRRNKMGRRDCAKKVAEGLHHLVKVAAE